MMPEKQNPRSWIDLRARLWLVMVFVLLPALGYIAVTAMLERNQARPRVQADLLAEARLAAGAEQQSLDEMGRTLVLAALLPARRDAAQTGNPGPCPAGLAQIAALYPQALGFAVWNLKGDAICADTAVSARSNAAGKLWFRQALDTHTLALGDFELGPASSQPALAFGYPLTSSAGALG